ncbi:MAG: bifunctional riboflavin kinase/FMN adenylyltransferase, partial [Novosphingobium sp.]|nr:bifunctional riboflavin kinase/FMN adenylyltransferase [Novosphingobium sp.]
MRLDSLEPVPDALRGGIVALGNFDGFHLGHQAVVAEAIAWARAEGRPAIVATFDPHPVRHFTPDTPPFRLTTLDQRQELFGAAGADAMLVIHFDAALAGMTAGDWIEKGLVGHLGAAGVVTGDDFTFGKARSGNPQVLVEHGGKLGLRAKAVGAVTLAGEVVSSSGIRHA